MDEEDRIGHLQVAYDLPWQMAKVMDAALIQLSEDKPWDRSDPTPLLARMQKWGVTEE